MAAARLRTALMYTRPAAAVAAIIEAAGASTAAVEAGEGAVAARDWPVAPSTAGVVWLTSTVA